MTHIRLVALTFLLFVNAWTFFSFRDDKQRAVVGRRRIPESNLLGLAMMGGSPGALLGRRIFRHKTRKEPFSTQLYIIAMLQIGGILGYSLA